jgi:hypothetical protein
VGSTLFDEVRELGYGGAYSMFTRALRRHQARPHCGRWRAVLTESEDFPHLVHPLDQVEA